MTSESLVIRPECTGVPLSGLLTRPVLCAADYTASSTWAGLTRS